MSLYGRPDYARTCRHLGVPRTLPRSGVNVLVRPIAGEAETFDACAPYPLLHVPDWRAFAADLEAIDDLVSLVAVVDPACAPGRDVLATVFRDRLLAFKPHHLVRLDPSAPLAHVHPEHRRRARRAAERVEVEVVESPGAHAFDWVRLYGGLRARHGIRGAADFPEAALAAQLELPGMMLVRAVQDGRTISIATWCVSGERAHYHLGASDEQGYAAQAAYAVFAVSLPALAARGVTWIDLGGAAGGVAVEDGLARFKRGWANDVADAWLGGRVLAPQHYARLVHGRASGTWFPAYRAAVAA